jgi:hypothetical protein
MAFSTWASSAGLKLVASAPGVREKGVEVWPRSEETGERRRIRA